MRRITIAVLALGMAACTNSSTTGPSGSLSGTYRLQTINGSPVPYTFASGVTLQSDVLTLSSNGNYSDAAQYSDGRLIVEQGYYNNYNGAITFTDQSNNNNYQGSISGTVLTEIVSGLTEVYQKQ